MHWLTADLIGCCGLPPLSGLHSPSIIRTTVDQALGFESLLRKRTVQSLTRGGARSQEPHSDPDPLRGHLVIPGVCLPLYKCPHSLFLSSPGDRGDWPKVCESFSGGGPDYAPGCGPSFFWVWRVFFGRLGIRMRFGSSDGRVRLCLNREIVLLLLLFFKGGQGKLHTVYLNARTVGGLQTFLTPSRQWYV